MRQDVHRVRVAPRWPAEDETFATGWDRLDAAEPLRGSLTAWPGREHPLLRDHRWPDRVLRETLLHLCREAGLDTLVLLVGHPDACRLLRVVQRDGADIAQPVLVVSAATILQRVVETLGVDPRVVLEVDLTPPGPGARAVGWLVALGDDPERAAHAAVVLEQTAWVIARAVEAGLEVHGDDLRAFLDGVRDHGDPRSVVFGPPDLFPSPPSPAPRPEDRGPPGQGDPALRAVDENVQFTVYRPRRLPPAVWRPVLAFAHLAERRADASPDEPDPVEEVRRQARQLLGDDAAAFADSSQDSSEAIPREGEITFALDLPGVQVNPPQRCFRWVEDVHREEFRVRAPAALEGQTVRGALHVYLGALLVADVALTIRVERGAAGPAETLADRARPYRRIFPSYSHRDETIVRQVESYARTMGDEYLRDVTHLRAGEAWNDRLLDFIRSADVFQLFWSRNSMLSPWVRQEWEFALSLARPHFIRPTYWEVPMPEAPDRDLPPATLRALHFQRLPVVADADDDRTMASPPRPEPAPAAPPSVSPTPAPLPGPPAAPPTASQRPRRRRLPTALAALLFVGMVGGTVVWRQVRLAIPPPGAEQPGPLHAVSPDGMVTASMDAAGRIQIASRAGGDPLVIATRFRPPDIAAMRFSADGGRIVCELRDGTTVEWDARTGSRIVASRLERRLVDGPAVS